MARRASDSLRVDVFHVGNERMALFSFPRETDLPVTHAEHRVVTELLTGRSNREIARALGISERTVATHVSAILRKLGVGSRTELAARMAERLEAKGDP